MHQEVKKLALNLQLLSVRAEIQTQVCLIPKQVFVLSSLCVSPNRPCLIFQGDSGSKPVL